MSAPTAAEVFALALEVFHPEGVCIWMTAPNALLDQRRPVDLLEAGEGERVEALLVALAEGVIL